MKLQIAVIKQADGSLAMYINKQGKRNSFEDIAHIKDGEIVWGRYKEDLEVEALPGVVVSIQAGEETPGASGGWRIDIDTDKVK